MPPKCQACGRYMRYHPVMGVFCKHCDDRKAGDQRAGQQPSAEATDLAETPMYVPLENKEKPELISIIKRLSADLDWYVAERNRLLVGALRPETPDA